MNKLSTINPNANNNDNNDAFTGGQGLMLQRMR